MDGISAFDFVVSDCVSLMIERRNPLFAVISINDQFFSSESFVVCVWRQRSRDQDDYEKQKSHNETRFQDPQSCS